MFSRHASQCLLSLLGMYILQGCKSGMTIRLQVAGTGGIGPVTGEAQWVLASLGLRCWEEGGGHAWSLSCVGTLGTNIGFGIGCAG